MLKTDVFPVRLHESLNWAVKAGPLFWFKYLGYFIDIPYISQPYYNHNYRQQSTMAKSTRSKLKRAFRAKKRTEGVYAATDAARLQRLNAKLRTLTTPTAKEEKEEGEEDEQEQDADMPGSCWFATLGLLDHQDISPALLHNLGF